MNVLIFDGSVPQSAWEIAFESHPQLHFTTSLRWERDYSGLPRADAVVLSENNLGPDHSLLAECSWIQANFRRVALGVLLEKNAVSLAVELLRTGVDEVWSSPLSLEDADAGALRLLQVARKKKRRIQEYEVLRREMCQLDEKRELPILQSILAGKTNRQMAEHLKVTMRTIEARRASIYRKLSVKNIVELVKKCITEEHLAMALRWGDVRTTIHEPTSSRVCLDDNK